MALYVNMTKKCLRFFSSRKSKLVHKNESLSLNTRQGSGFVHFVVFEPITIHVSIMRFSTFFYVNAIWVFDDTYLCYENHLGLYTMQELS